MREKRMGGVVIPNYCAECKLVGCDDCIDNLHVLHNHQYFRVIQKEPNFASFLILSWLAGLLLISIKKGAYNFVDLVPHITSLWYPRQSSHPFHSSLYFKSGQSLAWRRKQALLPNPYASWIVRYLARGHGGIWFGIATHGWSALTSSFGSNVLSITRLHPSSQRALVSSGFRCILASEESLRFACANNRTDFETGGIPQQGQTLVGQRVGSCKLHNWPKLNGHVGRVLKFHADQERWEVKLEWIAPGETTLKIGLKPANLLQCPSKFESPQEYFPFWDNVRSWSGIYAEEPKKTDDAAVAAALLDKLRAHGEVSDETICAICQEKSKSATASSMMLPCGHAFHLDCVLPWIRQQWWNVRFVETSSRCIWYFWILLYWTIELS